MQTHLVSPQLIEPVGVFTCPVDGWYYFSFSAANQGNHDIGLELVKGSTVYTTAWADSNHWDQGAMSVIVECLKNVEVYIISCLQDIICLK